MSTTRIAVSMLWLALMVLGAGGVSSQSYPSKPVRIVTSNVGGGNDLIARRIANAISGPLGQPVIIENRPVASTAIVAKALPDGYTLLVSGSSFWLLPLLKKVDYDPLTDFSPISVMVQEPNILVVNPSLPVNSVKELIALAKAKPGVLNYGTAGNNGGATHLAAELFRSLAGLNMVGVSYKGSGQVATSVLAGETQLAFAGVSVVAPFMKSGKLKALAITSASPRYSLPTVAESLPGYEPVSATVIVAPAKTLGTIISRLNREIVRTLNQPDVIEAMANIGSDIVASSPEQMMVMMKSDIARMGKVIKDAGIRAD